MTLRSAAAGVKLLLIMSSPEIIEAQSQGNDVARDILRHDLAEHGLPADDINQVMHAFASDTLVQLQKDHLLITRITNPDGVDRFVINEQSPRLDRAA